MIDIKPGACFTGTVNGAKFEIEKIEGHTAIVRDLKTGQVWAYGIEALKRLQAVSGA